MSQNPKKIAVVIVDRANYGRLKPVMKEIQSTPGIEMQVVCAGTMVLERFGLPVRNVRQDGFKVDSEIFIELEGSTPTTMAKSVGFAVIEFASEFQRLKPDFVLLIGDRYEAFAAALAASYMNICIAHIQGGEVSGSIDESARHCITKLAHYHFPSTKRSAEFIVRMGENPETVFHVGCPSSDMALNHKHVLPAGIFADHGLGAVIDEKKPYLLVVFHPVTTEFGSEQKETQELLNVLKERKIPTVWLWPNIDAGSDYISKVIRRFRETDPEADQWLRVVKNFTPEMYLNVLANASCALGNSSSFVRDSSFVGTPIVLIGDRQQGREIAENVIHVEPTSSDIAVALDKQIRHGRYSPSNLYGDGKVSQKIVKKLSAIRPYLQKKLHYVNDAKA